MTPTRIIATVASLLLCICALAQPMTPGGLEWGRCYQSPTLDPGGSDTNECYDCTFTNGAIVCNPWTTNINTTCGFETWRFDNAIFAADSIQASCVASGGAATTTWIGAGHQWVCGNYAAHKWFVPTRRSPMYYDGSETDGYSLASGEVSWCLKSGTYRLQFSSSSTAPVSAPPVESTTNTVTVYYTPRVGFCGVITQLVFTVDYEPVGFDMIWSTTNVATYSTNCYWAINMQAANADGAVTYNGAYTFTATRVGD